MQRKKKRLSSLIERSDVHPVFFGQPVPPTFPFIRPVYAGSGRTTARCRTRKRRTTGTAVSLRFTIRPPLWTPARRFGIQPVVYRFQPDISVRQRTAFDSQMRKQAIGNAAMPVHYIRNDPGYLARLQQTCAFPSFLIITFAAYSNPQVSACTTVPVITITRFERDVSCRYVRIFIDSQAGQP